MNKGWSRMYAAFVAALLVAGIGAVVVGRRAVTDESRAVTDEGPGLTNDGGGATEEAGATTDNEADLTLKAKVNNGRYGSITGPEALVGTSLRVHTWIVNEQRRGEGLDSLEMPTVRIATEDTPWINLLQFELLHVGTGDAGERTPEVLRDIDWKMLIPESSRGGTEGQELVVGLGTARVTWVIPPNMASRLPPGHYKLTATFDSRATEHADIVKVLLTSKPAYFQLRAPANKRERATVILSQASHVASYDRDQERALALVKSAQELDPEYMKVHMHLGTIYRVQRRWEEAIEEYTTYLEYLQTQDLPPSEDGPVDHLRYLIDMVQKSLQQEQQEHYREQVNPDAGNPRH